MPWIPGKLSGDPFYEIHDLLLDYDGEVVAVLECFVTSPDTYYCNAWDPQGNHYRIGAGSNLDTTRDWAERVTGLKPDRPIVPEVNP